MSDAAEQREAAADLAEDTAQDAPGRENTAAGPGSSVDAAAEPAKAEPATARLKEPDSLFPFSVTVGRLYDGPLDLLLDLIRRQDIDISDIPIARITAQFLGYVERLKETDVDNAGEFIYTAALLIQIKSRMLLPRITPEGEAEPADDPRAELVERLLEHERYKNAAQMLMHRQQVEAATWTRPLGEAVKGRKQAAEGREGQEAGEGGAEEQPFFDREIAADVPDLVRAFQSVLDRLRNRPVLEVEEDAVTVGQMMDYVRRRLLLEDRPVALSKLLKHLRSERALITLFLAMLEMVRLQAVLLRQEGNFAEILVKKHVAFEALLEGQGKG